MESAMPIVDVAAWIFVVWAGITGFCALLYITGIVR